LRQSGQAEKSGRFVFQLTKIRIVRYCLTGRPADFLSAGQIKMNLKIIQTLRAKNLRSPRLVYDGRPFVGGICLHDTAGSGTHNDTAYLANPGDGRVVSVDFTIERDGSIYQLNPDLRNHFTLHAGRATSYRTGNRRFLNAQVNRVLIGIELVQKADLSLIPVWPVEQIQAAAELCLFLCQTFNLVKEQITTHAQIITDGSRTDPRKFPFDSFWFYFNRAAKVPTLDPAPAPGMTQPTVYTVKDGDSLFAIAKQFGTSIENLKSLNGINAASNLIRAGQNLVVRK
jgi:N-acetyl-anhydromuramyl-L-alanine amidase AmpD